MDEELGVVVELPKLVQQLAKSQPDPACSKSCLNVAQSQKYPAFSASSSVPQPGIAFGSSFTNKRTNPGEAVEDEKEVVVVVILFLSRRWIVGLGR